MTGTPGAQYIFRAKAKIWRKYQEKTRELRERIEAQSQRIAEQSQAAQAIYDRDNQLRTVQEQLAAARECVDRQRDELRNSENKLAQNEEALKRQHAELQDLRSKNAAIACEVEDERKLRGTLQAKLSTPSVPLNMLCHVPDLFDGNGGAIYCLLEWMESVLTDHDFMHDYERQYRCPSCRVEVLSRPVQLYTIKHVVRLLKEDVAQHEGDDDIVWGRYFAYLR
ncbi:hypothetical protein BV25DRAFT_1842977 [Artomyces pyxidatus]|uniref:Uncharacterized protein n=1 Tax=Artomyces pyxidatus TaxID=48021 RepID=A0ACB8SHP9_9AGAM|nr:hypothetical protein BV25DRAFT_1842977 [Artomyces pyxidatus]